MGYSYNIIMFNLSNETFRLYITFTIYYVDMHNKVRGLFIDFNDNAQIDVNLMGTGTIEGAVCCFLQSLAYPDR